MKRLPLSLLVTFTILAFIQVATSRDLRQVTEPKTPQTCTSLRGDGKLVTEEIQKALNSCAKGKAVALSSGNFVSGPLTIPSGVSLLIDKGVTLTASNDAALYNTETKICGTLNERYDGCKNFITMTGNTGSGIYGQGTIDGQGDKKIAGKDITWWQLTSQAKAAKKNQNNPTLIRINNGVDITLHQITLKNSPYFHVISYGTNGFTVWGITIDTPSNTANTDGIDPGGSQNVTIANCNINTGDDNIAITAFNSPSRYISILNNHLGHGSSMGIGSGTSHGVSDVTVSGMTLINSRFGLYIKSNTQTGGLVSNIVYENICITNSPKPITLDVYRSTSGSLTPQFTNIVLNNVRAVTRGTVVVRGISSSHPGQVTIKDVHVAKGSKIQVTNAKVTGTWAEDASGTCGYAGNK
uniref:Glycoside hydrolase family 28 n=1 Tax=Aretaon asperrimus TaxID=173775 RepID=A0A191XSX8_9NEOP|nr:glycoside hydrolase family 28 [Aretaon asperrimus]